MVTENSRVGSGRNSIIMSSGLSGMVAAYINARALEAEAVHDESWQSVQAFRPRLRAWFARRAGSAGGGTAVVS